MATKQIHDNNHDLPSRYEIRQITAEHSEWARALIIYGFLLRTSIWTPLLLEPKTANALRALDKLSDYVDHAVNSGMSYGIFDTEYEYRFPKSEAIGGNLNWRDLDPDDPYLSLKMIQAMDFPLVSMAMAYDFYYERPLGDIMDILPLHPAMMQQLGKVDTRPLETWFPKGPGEVVCRTGTVTVPGYERRGLATALCKFMILEMQRRGFRGLMIGAQGRTIHRLHCEPPGNCKSTVLHHYDVEAIELDDADGKKIKPYTASELKEGWLVWLDL